MSGGSVCVIHFDNNLPHARAVGKGGGKTSKQCLGVVSSQELGLSLRK